MQINPYCKEIRGGVRLVYSDTGSIETLNPDAQTQKTHNTGHTFKNPIVVINLGQNRFQWELNSTSGGVVTVSFRNVSGYSATGGYKIFVFDTE